MKALLAPGSLLRDAVYRRLWTSILISSLGGQITLLALPLTAAVLLHATPTQMGWLTALELTPFLLLSLPGGVWLDRVRKLPVYVIGELALAVGVASVPLAWTLGWLHMEWLYVLALLIGTVYTLSGSAAQIVLTQVVPRERLVEAHAKNALASSGAEVAGPGLAGALIKLVGAPLALALDALLLAASAAILRGVRVKEENLPPPGRLWHGFVRDMRAGLAFVRGEPLLVTMAIFAGGWQMCWHAVTVVQILFATRTLGMTEQAVGLAYVALGVGTVSASVFGHRISARIGPGPCMALGMGLTGLGWGVGAAVPAGPAGVAAFGFMLLAFGAGAVLIFINFISLRQAVTPPHLLGRMTSTMRWLILLPAAPGALGGGWIGEHLSLRTTLSVAAVLALLLAFAAWRHPVLNAVRTLPKLAEPPPGAVGEELLT